MIPLFLRSSGFARHKWGVRTVNGSSYTTWSQAPQLRHHQLNNAADMGVRLVRCQAVSVIDMCDRSARPGSLTGSLAKPNGPIDYVPSGQGLRHMNTTRAEADYYAGYPPKSLIAYGVP